jgi:thiol-disulfide isomerase/thioredoxin/NAD-dependent dihydropyrimidine dehydrogenase PreA subunit
MKQMIKRILPSKRRLVQLYCFLLYNAHLKGFVKGDIFTGLSKGACVPGLNCYSCPGAVGACPLGSLQNAIASSGHKAPYYAVGILVLYGLIFGRTVCGFLCPFGLFQDLLYKIPTFKIPKGRFTRALSKLKYVSLLILVIVLPLYSAFGTVPLPAFCKYICPAGTLEGAVGLLANPENADKFSMLSYLFSWKFLLLVFVLALCVFLYRAFCRFLCPLGAIYGLFNRFSIAGVRVDDQKCVDCGKCVSVCKMDIRNVGGTECIQCGECIPSCPTGAISIKAGRITLKGPETGERNGKGKRRLAWLSALVLLLLVMVYANFPEKRPAEENQIASNETIPAGKEVGMRAPDFTAALYSGEGEIALNELRGKTVVLNFWATWCAPCVKELTHFEEIQTKYPEDVYVLALHSNLVTEDVGAYLKKTPYTFSFGLDKTGAIIESFGGSTMLPHTVVLDKNGVIVYNAVGSVTENDLEILIQKAKTK